MAGQGGIGRGLWCVRLRSRFQRVRFHAAAPARGTPWRSAGACRMRSPAMPVHACWHACTVGRLVLTCRAPMLLTRARMCSYAPLAGLLCLQGADAVTAAAQRAIALATAEEIKEKRAAKKAAFDAEYDAKGSKGVSLSGDLDEEAAAAKPGAKPGPGGKAKSGGCLLIRPSGAR